MINILIILLGLLLFVLYMTQKDKHDNLPTGPRGVPIFGNLLTLANAPHASKLLMEMAKEHGPVMLLKLGPMTGIVLTGYDVIREALVDKAEYFSSRPVLRVNLDRKNGIFSAPQWKERRRLALTSMRDFGLGKKSLDERMYEEAGILIQELETSSGKLVNLHTLLPVVTTNIICSIIRGERFAYSDEVMKYIVTILDTDLSVHTFANTERFLKWAQYIPFLKGVIWKRKQNFARFSSILQDWVKEHKETFDKENIRDLIDLFISESHKEEGNCKEENILPIIRDLFVAGTETTSTTLLWSIAYLIVHKDVQTKCRKEIHEIVGREQIPRYSYSKDLPYLNSFLNEVQRMANIVPLSLFHATSGRVELGGYTIPKDCVVIVNLESALKDEKYWGDPYTFRPERWLDEDGKLIKVQANIPFSTGKRECLGELLAKKELFIFLSSMLQNFEFGMEDGTKPPDLAKGEGVVRSAPKYRVRVHKI